ncbi:MAG: glycosyltransferase family 2 protein [Verrucomicrobiae bacterium]|nr:glycosyltransferase family 2 protein [Verrucomicrobiae bacterium]
MNDADHILSGLLYGQSELDTICAARPFDWLEYAHMNEFHGNAWIFKQYANLPGDAPLPFGIEHAIPYDLQEAYTYDLNSGLPMFLAVHDRSARLYRRKGMTVYPVGFSHLYAMDLFTGRHPTPAHSPPRSGTLVFPDKSTLLMNTDFDRESFVRRLLDLPGEYQPVVACIYWRDYIRGTHRPFEKAGIPLVSCGHLRDGLFLLRFHDLCRRFRYACANDISGSFTLSILSGCHFFHLPGGPLRQEREGRTEIHPCDPGLGKPHKAACLEASPFPPADPGPQRALAEQMSGLAFKQTPENIRSYHEQACRMLASRGTGQRLRLPNPDRLGELFAFRPVGVDVDGWCRPRAVFHIPTHLQAARITFHGRVPRVDFGTPFVVRVLLNGTLIQTRRVFGRKFKVTVILPRSPGHPEHTVEFLSGREFALCHEERRRSFHLHQLRVSSARSPLHAVYRFCFAPRLGVLTQHPPRPCKMPTVYFSVPKHTGPLPVISILTPTLNHAAFVERTIRSVLGQNYPALEYLIQDGGSTDGAVALVEKFRPHLKHFETTPDRGQADAINRGFQRSGGPIMAYLNSDDVYLPGTLHAVARHFTLHPDVDVVYGHRLIIDGENRLMGEWIMPPHDGAALRWADFIPQETLFWRRRIWEKAGGCMDETYDYALDWDLLLRFQEAGAVFERLPRFLAAFRVHTPQKTTSQTQRGRKETDLLHRRNFGRSVDSHEISRNLRGYLSRSLWHHWRHRCALRVRGLFTRSQNLCDPVGW